MFNDSFDEFKDTFSTAAKTVFGSGWAWLVVGKNGEIAVMTTAESRCANHGRVATNFRLGCVGTCLLFAVLKIDVLIILKPGGMWLIGIRLRKIIEMVVGE